MTLSTHGLARFRWTAPALILSLAAGAGAQEVLLDVKGDAARDFMGYSVAGVGDVDGDGVPDVMTVAPGVDDGWLSVGEARVVSGANGATLYRSTGDARYEGTMNRGAGVGDVDADGIPDFALGVPFNTSGTFAFGTVYVYSGADGSILHQIDGDPDLDWWFGTVIAAAGDLDGDGHDDLLVGAALSTDPSTGITTGAVTAISGSDAATLSKFYGVNTNDRFGNAVHGGVDLDGDGVPDFVVGAPEHDDFAYARGRPGYVIVFDGAEMAADFRLSGDRVGDNFGASVTMIGDDDGDGVPDLLIGEPWDKTLEYRGSVHMYSGANGSHIRRFLSPDAEEEHFGSVVRDVGDFDGDGLRDFAIGNKRSRINGRLLPSTHLFSGASRRHLYSFRASTQENITLAVSAAGDLDRDGFADVVLGEGVAFDGLGRAWVVGGNDLFLVAEPRDPVAGQDLNLTTRYGARGLPALLALTGIDGAPRFQVLATGTFPASGQWTLGQPVPPGLSGIAITLRSLAMDPGGALLDTADEEVSFR